MKRAKPFKPTSPSLRKDMADARREFNKWHPADSRDQPQWTVDKPHDLRIRAHRWQELENERAAKRQRDLILYAAAIGQKAGVLPADVSTLTAEVRGTVVDFYTPDKTEYPPGKRNVVTVTPRFLDWAPSEPTEEVVLAPPPY